MPNKMTGGKRKKTTYKKMKSKSKAKNKK